MPVSLVNKGIQEVRGGGVADVNLKSEVVLI